MEQLTLLEYQELGYAERKERIRNNNNRIVQSMIENGYILKQIREDRSYLQDGYKDINDFAKGEFGYSTSTTSRFMGINTKFSEGGNSPFIRTEYANYGRSKLQEMLTMNEEDFELITEDTTVEQIRELKSLEKQEEKAEKQEAQNNLPIVQMVAEEETEEVATSQVDPFNAVMIEYWKNRVEILKQVHNNMISPEDLAEELCPSGSKTFYHGIFMIFLYDINGGIKVRFYKDGKAQIDTYTYAEWIDKTNEIVNDEIFNELTKPVQKKESEPVVEEKPKKEWKEPKVEVKEQKKEKVPVPEIVEKKSAEMDNQPLPGQTTVDDLPGVVPEDTQEVLKEETNKKDKCKCEYFCIVAEASEALRNEQYDIAIKNLQDAIEMVSRMQELSEKEE